jgi:Na+/phosphate symporter
MLMDEITTDFVILSLQNHAPAIPSQTWCARSVLGRFSVRNQYYVHERAMQTVLSHNLFNVTVILPRIYLEECVSYIIFSFRIPGNSTEEMETAFEELERALVRYKNSNTLQIHPQLPLA